MGQSNCIEYLMYASTWQAAFHNKTHSNYYELLNKQPLIANILQAIKC